MIAKEKLLIMESPLIGKVINSITVLNDYDLPRYEDRIRPTVEGIELLLGVYLNLYDYDDELNYLIEEIDSLELLDTIDVIVTDIKINSTNTWSGFTDIKIVAPRGIMALIFFPTA